MAVENYKLPATKAWAPQIAPAVAKLAQDDFERSRTWSADRAGSDPTETRREPPRWPRVFPGL